MTPQISVFQVTAAATTAAGTVTVAPVPLPDGFRRATILVKETTGATTARITTASTVSVTQMGYPAVSLAYNAVNDLQTGLSVDLSGLIGVDLTTGRRGTVVANDADANAVAVGDEYYPMAGVQPAALGLFLQNATAAGTYQITFVFQSYPVVLSQGGWDTLAAAVT